MSSKIRTVNIGVVGFGGCRGGGMTHVGNMVMGGHVVCVAAFEPSDEGFSWACKHFEAQPRRYPSVREMAGNKKLDGIIIASPNHCHLSNLKELKGLSLPVMLEKPLDSTWEKICELALFARSYTGNILIGHCLRYAPLFQRVKELIEQGAVGRICSVRYTQNCPYGNGMFHNWRREKSKGGTMMIEKATHDLDIIQWLIDAYPTSVFASTKQMAFGGDKPDDLICNRCDERLVCQESDLNQWYVRHQGYGHVDNAWPCCYAKAADVPDDEICLLQYESGVHVSYIATYYTPECYKHREIQIVGLGGVMEISQHDGSGKAEIAVYPRYGKPGEVTRQTFNAHGRGHLEGDQGIIRHFYDVIVKGVKPQTTVYQAFLAEAVGYAAMRSNDERREVKLEEIIPKELLNGF
jgi:predicted dehydrogenase